MALHVVLQASNTGASCIAAASALLIAKVINAIAVCICRAFIICSPPERLPRLAVDVRQMKLKSPWDIFMFLNSLG